MLYRYIFYILIIIFVILKDPKRPVPAELTRESARDLSQAHLLALAEQNSKLAAELVSSELMPHLIFLAF